MRRTLSKISQGPDGRTIALVSLHPTWVIKFQVVLLNGGVKYPCWMVGKSSFIVQNPRVTMDRWREDM